MEERFLKGFACVVAAGTLAWVLFHWVLPCLWPFLAGGAVAVALRPAARGIRSLTRMSWKASAAAACLLFYAVFGMLLWNLGFLLFAQGAALFTRLPELFAQEIHPGITRLGDQCIGWLQRFFPAASRQMDQLSNQLTRLAEEGVSTLSTAAMRQGADFAGHLPAFLLALSFAILSSFFFLMDYQQISSFLLRQLPRSAQKTVLESKVYLMDTGRRVVEAYFLLMLLTFGEVAVGLWLLRVEYFAVMGLLVAAVDILPILGSGSILIPWGLYLLLTGQGPLGAGILILYGVVTVVRTILEPKLLGNRIGLHPLATILSMYLGLRLGGFGGLILAPIVLTLLLHLDRAGHIHLFR